ncbi:MAG: CHRD domain-containing protein [Chloroflexota bacterium]|jgi:hypothetical protein
MRRNKKILTVFGLAALLLVLIMAVGVAFAGNGGAPRVTTLSGAEEAPGPGDPDGSGFASIRLNVGQERVCWQISYEGIAPAAAAHIHRAPAGSPGPVVVPLDPNQDGCTWADGALIQEIIDYPDRFYVNVHNADYPAGALRGQLSNPGQSE